MRWREAGGQTALRLLAGSAPPVAVSDGLGAPTGLIVKRPIRYGSGRPGRDGMSGKRGNGKPWGSSPQPLRSNLYLNAVAGVLIGTGIGISSLYLIKSREEVATPAQAAELPVANPDTLSSLQPFRAPEHAARGDPSSGQGVTFSLCHFGGGTNCVVDGDTIWFQGVKIRIADIDAPETHPPRCEYEADLGDRATQRLRSLLNEGPIDLQSADRDEDQYGRKLRIVTRGGQSLGSMLVAEGLARPWTGHREPWC